MSDEIEQLVDEQESESESYLHPVWRIFATAYADPSSPTYGDKGKSYRVAYPLAIGKEETEVTSESARRAAYKLLAKEVVQGEIDRIRLAVRGAVGLTKDEYMETLLSREEFYAKRGEKGDAMASANILKLIGQAGGFLIIKKEDVTPPERRIPSGETAVAAILAAAERLKRLREPASPQSLPAAPQHALASVEEQPIQVVDDRPRCHYCDGQRLAIFLTHWSGQPTCKVCDAVLNSEKRRRERDAEAAREADAGSAPPESPHS